MAANMKAFELVGVSYSTYVRWCKEKQKPINSRKTMAEFFCKIREGRLAIDYYGNLHNKHASKKGVRTCKNK